VKWKEKGDKSESEPQFVLESIESTDDQPRDGDDVQNFLFPVLRLLQALHLSQVEDVLEHVLYPVLLTAMAHDPHNGQ
jgi:hypothetical protein